MNIIEATKAATKSAWRCAALTGARTQKGCVHQIERLRKKAAKGVFTSWDRLKLRAFEEAYPILANLRWEARPK